MRKLIESTHVSLGGKIGSPQNWAFPYLDNEHMRYPTDPLAGADALLLGRRTTAAVWRRCRVSADFRAR